MSQSTANRSNGRRRRTGGRQPARLDIWRTSEPLTELEPIRVPHDATALLKSLGDPPMHGATASAAMAAFSTVIKRSAAIAAALALSADLLATDDE